MSPRQQTLQKPQAPEPQSFHVGRPTPVQRPHAVEESFVTFGHVHGVDAGVRKDFGSFKVEWQEKADYSVFDETGVKMSESSVESRRCVTEFKARFLQEATGNTELFRFLEFHGREMGIIAE